MTTLEIEALWAAASVAGGLLLAALLICFFGRGGPKP